MRERAAILWHLMKKDWRYVRGWAALCGAVTVTAWLWILAHGALQFVAFVHYGIAVLLPAVALIRLFQLDAPLGSTAFALTRPIDRVDALTAKALTGAVAIALPTVLLAVAPLTVRGFHLRPLDYGVILASTSLRFAMVAAVALAVAAFTRTLAQAAVAAAGAVVAVGTATTIYSWVWPLRDPAEPDSFWCATPVIVLGQALAIAYVLHRTRRVKTALVAVAVMAALFATLHRTWAWDILRPFRTAEGTVARGLPSAWPVQVVVASQPISWYMLSGERVARASILVRSLPAGLSLVQVGYDVRTDTAGSYARGDLDRGIRSRDVLSLSEPAGIPSPWQAALQCPAGLAQRQAGEGVTGRVEIFRQTTLDGRPWPGRVHGILRFLVVRPRVREAVTIGDTGARLGLGPSRVYAHHVSDRDAATGLALRTERLYVFPFPPRDARTNVMLAFFDPATGDCIVPTTHGKTIGALSLPVVAVDWSVTEWRRVGGRGPSEVGPVPDGLQLAVVENEVIGTLEAPFEVTLPALADNRAL